MHTMNIHQTHWCAENELPPLLAGLRLTVVKQNPKAKHRYWSDATLHAFIAARYPALLPAFQTARVGVQRSDLGRLVVLHAFGGLYVDLDVECLRPFSAPLVGGSRLAVAPEPEAQVAALYGSQTASTGGVYLCNAVMYAPAGDPVIAACLGYVGQLWAQRGADMWSLGFDVLGGRLLTRMWTEGGFRDGIDVLPSAVCYPINDLKLKDLPTHASDVAMARSGCFGPETQAVHWWVHTNFEGRDSERFVAPWPFLAALYDLK